MQTITYPWAFPERWYQAMATVNGNPIVPTEERVNTKTKGECWTHSNNSKQRKWEEKAPIKH